MGRFPNATTYQCYFTGEDEQVDLSVLQPPNADNPWVDVENLRVVEFRKIQQGWPPAG